MKTNMFILLLMGCLVTGSTTALSAANFQISIDKLQDVVQGRTVDFSIRLDSTQSIVQEMGGFDLLIQWQSDALSFVAVDTGAMLNKCNWEYFTYRYGPSDACTDTICRPVLHIIAVADLDDGLFNHPDCFGDYSGELAKVTVTVAHDPTWECQYLPIRFLWYDCGDNTITSVSGNDLQISDAVWDVGVNIAGQSSEWSYFGALEECLTTGTTNIPTRNVDFINGGIEIVCADSIDAIGDINLNGIANEIADNVLFLNYYLYGSSAFTVNVDGQIAATDVNRDGTPLSIWDFVYQTRLIHGDMLSPTTAPLDTIQILHEADQKSISQFTNSQLGAMLFLFNGEISAPLLHAAGMTLDWHYDGAMTVVVVHSIADGNAFGQGEILSWSGTGSLLDIYASTWAGGKTHIQLLIPTDVDDDPLVAGSSLLHQNYPNPFNNSTVISFELGRSSLVTIDVLDLLGRTVWSESGQYSSGVHSLDWPGVDKNGNEVASGMYFYRLTSDDFTKTRKMLLVK